MTKNQANHLKNLRTLNTSRRPKPSRPIVRMPMTIIVPISANKKIIMIAPPLCSIDMDYNRPCRYNLVNSTILGIVLDNSVLLKDGSARSAPLDLDYVGL